VAQWAVDEVEVKQEHADKLTKQEINGKQLLKMTRDQFERMQIPMGPAGELVDAINQILGPNFFLNRCCCVLSSIVRVALQILGL
jgi:hypothetical protein